MKNDKENNSLSRTIERLQRTMLPDDGKVILSNDDVLYSYLANLPSKICSSECPIFDSCKLKDEYEGKKCPIDLIDSLDELKGFVENVGLDAVDPVTIRRLLEYVALSALEKEMLREISSTGVAIDVPLVGKDNVITTTISAHPLLSSLMAIIKERGKILESYIMTPKAKADAKKTGDSSVLKYISHIIEAEIVEDEDRNKKEEINEQDNVQTI